jgi:hypothetical protein
MYLKALGIGAVIAFGKAASSAYEFSKKFETAMIEVATISDEVFGKFDEYKDKILQLASQGSQAPEELAQLTYIK